MIRVRMFCDWDNDSRQLIERLKTQTFEFVGDIYRDIMFTDGDYDVAIGFNYVQADRMKARLVLEPPEIYVPQEVDDVPTYSFVETGLHQTAYGLGFATAPRMEYPSRNNRPHYMMMICSNKTYTPFHHKRLEVREALMRSSMKIDFYGRGMGTPIPPMSKHKVLPQYNFCIDFENSINAVTDKYFDPVICNTIPITNSPILAELAPMSCEIVDFNGSVSDIVDQIQEIYDSQSTLKYMISIGRTEIYAGKMSLAKWIYERVIE